MTSRTQRALLFCTLPAALLACGDDGGPVFDNDAAVDMGTMPDIGPDGGPTDMPPADTEAPTVVSTEPESGAMDVGSDAGLTVTFSEPMAELGTVEATHAGSVLTLGTASWDETNEVLTVAAPAAGWPEGMVEVALLGFTDVADNALPTYRFGFSTAPVPPTVAMASPGEGSTVSPRTEEIVFDFDEPMNNARGSLAFDGGSATVTGSRWLDGDTIAFSVEGLEYEQSYRAVLADFADRRGTPLDGTPVLGDGALDFSTGTDTDGPRVVDANPTEGQVEVDPGRGTATVYFDEPMDTSVGTATLEVDGTSTALAGTWSDDSTLVLDVAALLVPNQSHRIVLDGYTDVLGNPLDGTFLLGDGAIDFDVSRDLLPPFVGFSDPLEGSNTGSYRRNSIVIFFSEEMNQSTSDVTVQAAGGDFMAPGTWNASGTQLTLDVTDQLIAGESYRIDFTNFRDLRGTFLQTDHPYLVDGFLDWTTAPPTGENCRDILTVDQADVADGAFTWTVTQTDALLYDGSADCDPTPEGTDSVVRYTKTTQDTAGGGTVLKVTLEGSESNLEVLAGTCDPTAATANQQLRCIWNISSANQRDVWESYHDVGPGDYYIWFGSTDDRAETDFVLTVEEVPAPPVGDSCLAPFDSTSPNFTAGTGDEIGTWTWAEDEFVSFDVDVSVSGPGVPQCASNDIGRGESPVPNSGSDAVIEIQKTSDTSILDVTVQHVDGNFLVGQLQDTCNITEASGGTVFGCAGDLLTYPGHLAAEGPAGNYYVWVAADRHNRNLPAGTVTAREVEPQPGDTCATAIPLSEGANPTTAFSAERFYRPSCFRDDSDFPSSTPPGLTWYRLTTTELVTSITATAADDDGDPFNVPVAVIDAATGAELSCTEDTPAGGTTAVWGAGQEVCVAVESGTITDLALRSSAYDGVGQTVMDLNIERPLGTTGNPVTWTGEYWMAVTPTSIYLGTTSTTSGLVRAPLAGGVTGEALTMGLTTSVLGFSGVNIGEAIFVMDNGTLGMGDTRIHRAINSAGTLAVTPWDTTNVYITDDAIGMDYDGTELIFATERDTASSMPTHFYAVDPTTPDTTRLLGTNDGIWNVAGLTVDATHIYMAGNLMDDEDFDGVYRIARADLGTPATAPELIALVDVSTTGSKLDLHTTATTTYLYFRDAGGHLHVADVGGATPAYLGVLSDLGRSGDHAFIYDSATDAIYLFESETVSTGRIVRLD